MALLTSSSITAEGTYDIKTVPGAVYVFAASGTFGGGTLAISWVDAAGNTGAISSHTAAVTATIPSPGVYLRLVLTGATDPSIAIACAEQAGITPESIGAATAAQGALADTALQPGEVSAPPLSPVTAVELANHQNLGGVANQQLTIWTFGDSMMYGSRLPAGIRWLLHQKVPIIGYALEEILTTVVSGTVVAPPANSGSNASPTLWDTGKVWKMSSGAVLRAANSSGGLSGIYSGKAVFYCSKQTGGGTATIEYSRDGGTSWLSLGTLDTNGTNGTLARTELTPGAGLGYWLYRITATGGPVNYIGCKLYDNTRSGVILCNSNMGGITVASTLQAQAEVRNGIAADMGYVVLVSQFREATGELDNTILGNFLDAWETAIPNGEILLVEQCDVPSLSGNEYTATVNELYRSQAASRTRVRTYDINSVLGSESERVANGFFNAGPVGTVTVDAGTNLFTTSGSHGLAAGSEVFFKTTGTLPSPLQAWTMENPKHYYVKTAPGANTLTLSETVGGAELDIADTGTGTHTLFKTDTIHMSQRAWHHVGADLAHRMVNFANGTCPINAFRDGSGFREVAFGGFAEEYAPSEYTFRMARASRGRWGVVSKTSLGGLYRMGFICHPHNATFADGVTFELWNDSGYKNPMTIDGTGYVVFGPYNATTQSGYTRGGRLVVDEDQSAKSALVVRHRHATPSAPVQKWEDSGGNNVAQVDYLGTMTAKHFATAAAYADDAAAATGGVPVGAIYRKTDGTVVWRQA